MYFYVDVPLRTMMSKSPLCNSTPWQDTLAWKQPSSGNRTCSITLWEIPSQSNSTEQGAANFSPTCVRCETKVRHFTRGMCLRGKWGTSQCQGMLWTYLSQQCHAALQKHTIPDNSRRQQQSRGWQIKNIRHLVSWHIILQKQLPMLVDNF